MTATEFQHSRDSWKQRVASMLKKAETTDSPEEAAAFTAKAAEIMAVKQIEKAEVEALANRAHQRPDEAIDVHRFEIRKPIIQKGVLLNAIVLNFGGYAVREAKPRKQKVEYINVYAFTSDLEMIKILWASILVQGERFLAQEKIPTGLHPPTFKRAWWAAFAGTIFTRLEAEQNKAMAASNVPGTALALRDKKQRVKDDVHARTPNLRNARRTSRRRNEGYTEGRAAGQRVDLGSGSDRLPGQKKQITR